MRAARVGGVSCAAVRESLSAGLDGETGGLDEDVERTHLAACTDCREWRERVHELTRRIRLAPAPVVPDRVDAVATALLADAPAPAPHHRILRAALLATAATQVALLVVPALVLGRAGPGVPAHASRELGAFGLAVAVSCAIAALRPPSRPGPVVPASLAAVVLAAGVGIVVAGIVDSALGSTTPLAEAPDLLILLGAVLLIALRRRVRLRAPAPRVTTTTTTSVACPYRRGPLCRGEPDDPDDAAEECRAVRETLSAGLDAESGPLEEQAAALHLASCTRCRAWCDGAEELARRVRESPSDAPPDRTGVVVEAVLAGRAATADPPGREHGSGARRRDGIVRAALAATAAAQLAIVAPALVLADAGVGVPPHAGRELGAFGLALAVGFALAATRPALARGALVPTCAATVLLVAVAAVDTLGAETTVSEELPRLVTVVGAVLLAVLARHGSPTRAGQWIPVGLRSQPPGGARHHGAKDAASRAKPSSSGTRGW